MTKLKTSTQNPVTAHYARSYFDRLSTLFKDINPAQVETVGELLFQARAEDRYVFIIGNGGSAASASHLAVDFGKGCSRGREKRFKVISLTDNTPWITAIANDISYDEIFSEQLINFAHAGDLVIAISASGNSKNVIRALEVANQMNCVTIGISGFKGGKIKALVKHHIHIPSEHMGMIEDGQMTVGHILLYGFMDAEGCG